MRKTIEQSLSPLLPILPPGLLASVLRDLAAASRDNAFDGEGRLRHGHKWNARTACELIAADFDDVAEDLEILDREQPPHYGTPGNRPRLVSSAPTLLTSEQVNEIADKAISD